MSSDKFMQYCEDCGDEYEYGSIRSTKCPKCNSFLTPIVCKTCGEYKHKDMFYTTIDGGIPYKRKVCKPCYLRSKTDTKPEAVGLTTVAEKVRIKSAIAENRLEVAVEYGKKLKPLTESEWHETCNHFGGCAMCGDPHIEVRYPWINPERGGRYVKSNIVPLCSSCLPKVDRYFDSNKFRILTSTSKYADEVKGIVDFIGGIIDEQES